MSRRLTTRKNCALALGGLQFADFVVTRVSTQFGDAHLDHLGVPAWLRPVLPVIKATAAAALVGTAGNPRRRSVVAGALVAYYSAAVVFHLQSDEGLEQAAPAALLGALAAAIIEVP
jgi:hypothetical protein